MLTRPAARHPGSGASPVCRRDRASADKIDDLTRALMQDASYKVRVQAALVLGKLGDKRAVPALIAGAARRERDGARRGGDVARAHRRQVGGQRAHGGVDERFVGVRAQPGEEGARGWSPAAARRWRCRRPRRARKFYVRIGFNAGGKAGPEYARLVRDGAGQGAAEAAGGDAVGGGRRRHAVASRSSRRTTCRATSSTAPSSGCRRARTADSSRSTATSRPSWRRSPSNSIKMMTTEGASLQTGSGPSEETSGKRDCLVGGRRSRARDVGKFLQTQQ